MIIIFFWQLNVLARSARYKILCRWHFEVFFFFVFCFSLIYWIILKPHFLQIDNIYLRFFLFLFVLFFCHFLYFFFFYFFAQTYFIVLLRRFSIFKRIIIFCEAQYYFHTTINFFWQLNVLRLISTLYKIFSRWHFEVFFFCYLENRCRHIIHIIYTGYDFLCKLSSVEISNLREMSKLVYGRK